MSKSYRYVAHGVRGRNRMNFNWPDAIRSSEAVVNITASEIKPGPRTTVNGVNQDFIYWVGDADVWVSNIAPHFNSHFGGELGGVEYILHVNFAYPLDIAITITVDDQPLVGVTN